MQNDQHTIPCMKSSISIKARVFSLLDVAGEGDQASRAVDIFIIALIALNIMAMVLDSVGSIHAAASGFFHVFEIVSIIIFSVEYILRIWSCAISPKWTGAVCGRLSYAATPLALIDLLAVLPFYLPFLGFDLRFIRAVRLFRIFRIAKMGRYSSSIQLFVRVLHAKKEALASSLFLLCILLLVSSSMLYYAERDAQPDAFSSIPAAMWWGVATLTTVGYGDVYPVTPVGRVLGAATAIIGIAMFALPTAILGAGFVEDFEQHRQEERTCPHCHKPLNSKE